MERNDIENVIKSVEECAGYLFQNNIHQVQDVLGQMIPNINAIYLNYINNCDKYAQYGVEIPVEVLLSQMHNLIDAIDNKDIPQMADSLWYEIREGLLFFAEIEGALSKQ